MRKAQEHLPILEHVLPGPYTRTVALVPGCPRHPQTPRALYSCPVPLGFPHHDSFFYTALSKLLPREATGHHQATHKKQADILLCSFYCFLWYYNRLCKKEKNKS